MLGKGYGIQDAGVFDAGYWMLDEDVRCRGLWFEVQGSGFKVSGFGCQVSGILGFWILARLSF